jgi:hypothetical protein
VDLKGDLTRALVEADMHVLLPHELLGALSEHYPVAFDGLFRPDYAPSFWREHPRNDPKLWQNPLLDHEGWPQSTIPLLLHGDGASFSNRDSLLCYSVKGLLTLEQNAHLLLGCFPKSCTASPKRPRLRATHS